MSDQCKAENSKSVNPIFRKSSYKYLGDTHTYRETEVEIRLISPSMVCAMDVAANLDTINGNISLISATYII